MSAGATALVLWEGASWRGRTATAARRPDAIISTRSGSATVPLPRGLTATDTSFPQVKSHCTVPTRSARISRNLQKAMIDVSRAQGAFPPTPIAPRTENAVPKRLASALGDRRRPLQSSTAGSASTFGATPSFFQGNSASFDRHLRLGQLLCDLGTECKSGSNRLTSQPLIIGYAMRPVDALTLFPTGQSCP